jgi:predicted Zn-dependent peptidase
MLPLTLLFAVAAAPPVEVWRASPQSPRLVLAPDPTAADAAIHVVFLAGAADDLIEEGLTRMSQYALLHGQDAAPFAALDAAVYGGGADLAVETSIRECSYTLTAPATRFDALAGRLLRQLLAAKVTDAGIERARRLALTDVLQVGSAQWINAFVAASVIVTEGVGGGGDYNNAVYGDREVLSEIPRASVRRHLAVKLAPANAIIVATGKFDAKKLKAIVGGLKGGKERPPRRPDIIKYLPFERNADAPRETHLQLQVVDVTDAKSAAVVHVLASYLHDRLFFKLRKSGHVYSPSVTTGFEEWLDFILVGFTVTPGGDADLRAVMMEEIDALESGTVDDASLRRAVAIARHRLETVEATPALYAQALAPRVRGIVTVGPEVRAALSGVGRQTLADASARFLTRARAVSFVFGTSRKDGNSKPVGTR